MKLEFKRTGFWWTDLGIAALNESLHSARGIRLNLEPSSLIVEGGKRAIQSAIRGARESLKDKVWGETRRGKMWWRESGLFFFKQYNVPDALPTAHDELKKGKSGVCDFCGSQGMVRSIGTSENPLMVTPDRMITFYPYGKGSVDMCWNCTFASAHAHRGIFSRRHGNFLNILVPEGADLRDLQRTLHLLGRLRAETPKGFINAKYPLEDFLGFVIQMWKHLNGMEIANAISGRRFHVFQAKLMGRVVSINRYYVVPDISRLLFLLNEVGKNLSLMAGNFYVQRARKADTLCREELSRRMLWGVEICGIIEDFLYATLKSELKGYFYNSCERTIYSYEEKVMKTEPELLENCKSLGRTLGRLSAEKDDKDILFALRSVRNLDDLLGTFHRIFTRHPEAKVYVKGLEEILQKIDDKNWKRYKNLIGIWTVLSYKMGKREEGG